jgi:hypothetical protein
MNKLMIPILLGLLSFSVALTAQDVTYNYDQSAEFSKFKSYKWVEIKEGVHPDQLMSQQITAALDADGVKRAIDRSGGILARSSELGSADLQLVAGNKVLVSHGNRTSARRDLTPAGTA